MEELQRAALHDVAIGLPQKCRTMGWLRPLPRGNYRAAVLSKAPYVRSYYLPSFEDAARSFNVESIEAPVHSDANIAEVITSLGREPSSGLVLISDAYMYLHRAQIISLAARHQVPTIFWNSDFVREGALLSYGANPRDVYYRAASYIDRILRGEKPADLPVQLPTKFEMAVNVKTATALGLTLPQSILLRADEVIE